jgi:hypothetical protein
MQHLSRLIPAMPKQILRQESYVMKLIYHDICCYMRSLRASSSGVPRAAWLSSGAHSGAVRACPDPSLRGDHTCNMEYTGQTDYMSCHLQGGWISARGPGGMGHRPHGKQALREMAVKVM